jgi:hypothetical protein
VSVKTAPDSDGGKGWYWCEILGAPSGNWSLRQTALHCVPVATRAAGISC